MAEPKVDRQRIRIAFIANITMFFTGVVGWYVADSTALLADALDMLGDASAYAFAWFASTRSVRFQQRSAQWSALLLIGLGIGVLIEAGRQFLHGGEPQGGLMMAFSLLSSIVNGSVLAMLSDYQHSEQAHLRATWLDTRTDVLVNISVLLSGLLISLTGYRAMDWIVGAAIGIYVIMEGIEIWRDAGDRN